MSTEEAKAKALAYQAAYRTKWAKEHPERLLAMRRLRRAVLTGKIAKPDACQECKQKPAHGLVPDIHPTTFQLRKWVCRSCKLVIKAKNGE